MSLVAGVRWSSRGCVRRAFLLALSTEATGGYCLGASQRASGGTAGYFVKLS
jgi:hypothetical protein